MPFWNAEMASCPSRWGAWCNAWRNTICSRANSPRLLLAIAQLSLLGGAGVHALEVADEDSVQLRPVIDLVAGKCRHVRVESLK
jgi:hypothetical protein